MQTFLDRLIAQGVFGSLPAAFVYTGMMFLFGVSGCLCLFPAHCWYH